MRYLPPMSLLAISPRKSELEPINTIPSRFSLNVAISRGKRPKGVVGVLSVVKKARGYLYFVCSERIGGGNLSNTCLTPLHVSSSFSRVIYA